MLSKQWKMKESPDHPEFYRAAEWNGIPLSLAKILAARSIHSIDTTIDYLNPSEQLLHDPFLMRGMITATTRVLKALINNKKILVYGDYDVDGAASTGLLYMFLKDLGANVDFYIPKRLEEGYGINYTGVTYAKDHDVDLLISVDCGITAIEETAFARQQGIDVIICDHHQPKDQLPTAVAILDPIIPGCDYPYKHLTGAGVAFKLAQAISDRLGNRMQPMKYLDLVAIAIAADIAPITGENRVLMKLGLDMINKNPRPGIKALLENVKLDTGQITPRQIVRSLAPRINAVGRLGDASVAVELLTTDDYQYASTLAKRLELVNEQRKVEDKKAQDVVDSLIDLENEKSIILYEEEWHPGVISILASRLVEKYCRPTIILTTMDGVAKGSARTISTFNIYEALQECQDLLIHFGGHHAAAGLALEINRIEEFKERFNKIVETKVSDEDLQPVLEIDHKISLKEITGDFIKIHSRMAPFGPANVRPTFLAENVEVATYLKVVGGEHLVFSVKQNGQDRSFDAIAMSFGSWYDQLSHHNKFDIVFSIDHILKDNRWISRFRIKDLKMRDTSDGAA